jgi:hypothetical protein
MARENVERIKSGWDAFLEEGIEGTFKLYAEGAEIVDPPELPDPVRQRAFLSRERALEAARSS